MSSSIYTNQNPPPVFTRRSPTTMPDSRTTAQTTNNRRSLGGRIRDMFRRNSSSPDRSVSSDRRAPPTSSVRQSSTTPTSDRSPSDTPQLRAPTIQWPFGKKKNTASKTVETPKTSKKKAKDSRTTNRPLAPPMEISGPIYPAENQTAIRGEVFAPRTPEQVHGSTGRIQSSTSSYEATTTTKGFRDYMIVDQTQYSHRAVVDDFIPSTYTSDRSRSPSMNRQRLPNTSTERQYYHDNSASAGSIPLADIAVIPTPQQKRRVDETSSSSNTRIVTEKPPIFPSPSPRVPSTSSANPTQWKDGSSSTLSKTGTRSTGATPMDVDAPKLHAPTIPFGSTSSKKKAKRSKSQTRTDGMSSSSSTISKLVEQNPTKPNRSWVYTYGSLPDAEIMYGSTSSSIKPSKSTSKEYPGLSAIVYHHLRLPPPTYVNTPRQSPPPTTTGLQPPRRFETSTTTLNEFDQDQSWIGPRHNGSVPSPSSIPRHDGYIRPMTPPHPSTQPDVSIIRVNINDLRGQTPSPRPARYDRPDSPPIYRSSTTIYTRDKHHYVDGGEIRTWSSRENGFNDDYHSSYQKPPFAQVEINYRREPPPPRNDYQTVPSKTKETVDEYRYSPRAHEQQLYEREQKRIPEQEFEEEERYEVSFEYEQRHHEQEQYSYEKKSHYDQLHAATRYSNDTDDDQNLTYSNLTSSIRSAVFNEREKNYDQSSRSYVDSNRIRQEPLQTAAPVHHSGGTPHSYTLKLSDSYDGLGISISANSETRSQPFIRDVEPGSPGHQAGLRKNDRIINVNGVNVENIDFSQVLILIKQGLDDDNLQLTVIHELEQN